MWIIFILAVASVLFFWRSNRKRGERFVRAVFYIDAVEKGVSSNEANGIVAKMFTKHSTAEADIAATHVALDKAKRMTEGSQLPWIHEARKLGFAIDSGSYKFDAASSHPLSKQADEATFEEVYDAASIHHMGYLKNFDGTLSGPEIATTALGVFAGTVQAKALKLTDDQMHDRGFEFVFLRLKTMDRFEDIDSKQAVDMIQEALGSNDLSEMRDHAGEFAFLAQSALNF